MNPLLINAKDIGGAANACLRLHQGLLDQGVNSKVVLKNKTNTESPETYQINLKALNRSFGTKISEKSLSILKELGLYKKKENLFLIQRSKGLEMFSYPQSNYDLTNATLYQQADIINLHWVADFLDYTTFFKRNKKPLVWTLHDQNPFTGGEHFKEAIYGIDKRGYPIQRELSKQEKEKFKEVVEIKQNALQGVTNLRIVALCDWMKAEVENSNLFNKFKVHTIPNGLDSNVFKPRDKYFSRELLNLPQHKEVLLFVSDARVNRKGFEYLLKAFEQINHKEFVLLSIGSKCSELIENDNLMELGYIKDELLMSVIYSAADVFVIPSLMDNLPNTVLESMMCGTPVIGFPVGGIPDMVQDGENGYLTSEISVPDLAKTIEKFFETSSSFNKEKIRDNAVRKYDLTVQAKNYINMYKDMLN